jgi:hypothetical protein
MDWSSSGKGPEHVSCRKGVISMRKHLSARIGATVAAGTFMAVCFAAPASAGKPAEQGCLGDYFSGQAQQFGSGFGEQVSFLARYGSDFLPIRNLGDGIQNLQAGQAPAFPDVCNTPE